MRPLLAAVALLAFGCHDHHEDDHHDGDGQSDIAIGCDHFEYGPHEPLTAAAGDDAPTAVPHAHYTVSVPAEGGDLRFTPPLAGEYLVLLNTTDATLAVTDADGAAVAAEATVTPGTDCPAAAVAHTFDLQAAPYTLTFGGATTVEVVIHGPAGQRHNHGHD